MWTAVSENQRCVVVAEQRALALKEVQQIGTLLEIGWVARIVPADVDIVEWMETMCSMPLSEVAVGPATALWQSSSAVDGWPSNSVVSAATAKQAGCHLSGLP